MIAVDTNVLLRRLLDDDPEQAERVHRLFDREESVLIPDIVLAETIWTLKGKRYKASKDDLVAMIMGLLEEPNVVFESRQAVWSGVNDYIDAPQVRTSNGTRSADLADALVVNKAKLTARRRGEGYGGTYTFDQAALALEGTKRP